MSIFYGQNKDRSSESILLTWSMQFQEIQLFVVDKLIGWIKGQFIIWVIFFCNSIQDRKIGPKKKDIVFWVIKPLWKRQKL